MISFIYKIFLLSVLQLSWNVKNIETACINPTLSQDSHDNSLFKPPILRGSLIETTLSPTNTKNCGIDVPRMCQGCNISYDDNGCFSGCTCKISKTF